MKKIAISLFIFYFLSLPLLSNAATDLPDVRKTQDRLTQLGYSPGPIDGIMGKKTINAIKNFQTDNNIPVSGLLDEETLKKLVIIDNKSEGDIEETSLKSLDTPKKIMNTIPFTWFFFTGCVLLMICFLSMKKYRKQRKKNIIKYYFCKNSLEFLIPFIIVSLFYYLLSILISSLSDYVNVQTLINMEEYLTQVKNIFSKFNLSPSIVLLILIIIYILGLLRTQDDRLNTISKSLLKYQKISRRIYIVVVLLCSFTLLGSQIGESTGKIKLRIKTIREGYANITNDVRDILYEQVTSEIYNEIKDEFPESYGHALLQSLTIEDELISLGNYYQKGKNEWKIKIESVESVIRHVSKKNNEVYYINAGEDIAYPHTTIKNVESKSLPKINYKKLSELKLRISNFRKTNLSSLELIKSEGGRKVLYQIPKVLTNEIKKSIIRQCSINYPILEPVINSMFNTLDNISENEFDKSVRRIVEGSIKDTNQLERNIKDESFKITSLSGEINISKDDIKKAQSLSEKTQKDFDEINNYRILVKNKIEINKSIHFNNLISKLTDEQISVRVSASQELSKFGLELKKSHIDKIINIMRNSEKEWSEFLYRQSHCEYYRDTKAKYYAADSILNMKSDYINDQLIKEAQDIKGKSITKRKVTDPGWI